MPKTDQLVTCASLSIHRQIDFKSQLPHFEEKQQTQNHKSNPYNHIKRMDFIFPKNF